MVVNNLALPECLVALIQSGTWPRLVKLPYFDDKVRLYSLEEMESETATLTAFCTKGHRYYSPYYVGEPGMHSPAMRHPGIIDMSKAVVIGDWGIDSPICLDYRDDEASPSVIALGVGTGWERVFADIGVLISMLPEG